ncbi:MAG: nucleotidyltransferase domain-containing protein, partial [Archaeoglobales archaeon]
HVLSEKELSMHPPLLLDLVHDAVIIYDTGVLERELRIVEEKLKKLGAKRVEKGKDRFWVLKPDIKPGEVIEI